MTLSAGVIADFVAANVLVALTYAMLGVLIGPRFGLRRAVPDARPALHRHRHRAERHVRRRTPNLGAFMPSHGAVRVLLDGDLTPGFDELGALALAIAWLAGVTALAAVQFHRLAKPRSA